jgi:hypothetical protein
MGGVEGNVADERSFAEFLQVKMNGDEASDGFNAACW